MKPNCLFPLVALLGFTLCVSAQPLPPGASLFGKTIGDWSADWVRWVYATCTNENPVLDPDGRWAGVGQPETPVFLLAGIYQFSATVERTVIVPENRYLFFPIMNGWVDNIGTIPPWTVEQLRDFERPTIDAIERLEAILDGSNIPELFSYRAPSPTFALDFTNECNLVSFILGTPYTGLDDPIVADGFYLMLQPLTVGQHLLVFGGGRGAPDFFTISATLHLNVVTVPLTQWLDEFARVTESAGLSDRSQSFFQSARRSFANGSLHAGISHLRSFRRALVKEMDLNASLIADLVNYSQRMIDRANRELSDSGKPQ